MLAVGMMLLATVPLYAQSTPVISGDRIRADMEVLSSDSFGGRKPGTPSERTTTDFIIRQFTDAGLAPAAGQGWLQPVKLVTRRMRSASLVLRGPDGATTDLSDAVAMLGSESSVALNNVPIVWDEFGGKTPAPGIAGALILYRDGDPPGLPQPQATDGITRLTVLAAAGARGALVVVGDDAFPKRKAALEAGITTLASDPTLIVRGIITESAAKRVIGGIRAPPGRREGQHRHRGVHQSQRGRRAQGRAGSRTNTSCIRRTGTASAAVAPARRTRSAMGPSTTRAEPRG